MQEDNGFYIQTINSDNGRDSDVDKISYYNTDDDSANGTFHEEPTRTSDDEEEVEQYDFDDWFAEQMEIHENGSEKSTGKENSFVKFLDNITSNSLLDYDNEMTNKTQHLPSIPPEMLSSYCHY